MPTGTKPREKREADFLARAKSIHGDKFDYSKFVYVNAKTKSIVICRVHGEFEQNPDKHLSGVHGCMQCFDITRGDSTRGKSRPEARTNRMSAAEYLEKLALPPKYGLDMSGYIGMTKGIVTLSCPDHGEQILNPRVLMISEYKCVKCALEHSASSRTKGYDDFLAKAKVLHGDQYIYPDESTYVNRKSKLVITCKVHGDFVKSGQKHLSGQGCFRCRIDVLVASGQLTGGYDEKLFATDEALASSSALIYFLKIGEFWKIGITKNALNRRVIALKSHSKKPVEVLDTFHCSLREAYMVEQLILGDFAEARVYEPWSTELFCVDVMEDVLLADYFESMLRAKELPS